MMMPQTNIKWKKYENLLGKITDLELFEKTKPEELNAII